VRRVRITEADREEIKKRNLKEELADRWAEMWNNPEWPPPEESPFEISDHLKGRLTNK
jgi:hypothetical protein